MMLSNNLARVPDDAELVNQSLAGNRTAFGRIISRYQVAIASLAYDATGNLGQSENLVQETFITAWKHLRHLRAPGNLRAWLFGIAWNRIINTLPRGARKVRLKIGRPPAPCNPIPRLAGFPVIRHTCRA
jgi:DNA-directed RNA polymerase specialized sigma24 family protein